MASIGDLLGGAGDTGKQLFLWGVLVGLINQATQPYQRDVTYLVNDIDPNVVLDPVSLADAVVKGWITQADAAAEAKKSGIDGPHFDLIVKATGGPIALQEALFAWRRGYIPFDAPEPGAPSVETAIKTSHVANLWSDTIRQLGIVPLGVADAVDAVVEGQIPYAEGEKIAYENGVDAADFLILFNTRGRPPAPGELIDLVRRGYIPMQGTGPTATTLQQGIYEGATKDKWEPLYEKLTEYLPPPRTITALERAGVITQQQATALYVQSGLSAQLAAAYSADASGQKIAADKLLAKAEVEKLYRFQVITPAEAATMLGQLGYNAHEAAFLLGLVDMQRAVAAIDSAVTRIGALYVGHKITATTATNTLNSLKLPASQVTELLATWDLERAASVKILTPAEIAGAFFYGVLDQATAQSELEHLGYAAHDAWVLLSVRKHAKLPGEPAA